MLDLGSRGPAKADPSPAVNSSLSAATGLWVPGIWWLGSGDVKVIELDDGIFLTGKPYIWW